jgi:hypothetical protein
MTLLETLGAFTFGFTVDALATLVFHFTQRSKPYAAASVNVLCQGLALFVWVDVSKNYWIAMPYLAGLWLGGVVGVKLKARLEKQ